VRLYLDLDSRAFLESPQFPRPLSSLVLKRRDLLPMDVSFLRGGIATELTESATGRLGLKADKDFNGPFVASDLEWVKSGAGETASYRFNLNLNTLQIDALFAGVPTPASVALMLEIEWIEGALRTSSSTLQVTLENDVVRGDEGLPEESTEPYPLPNQLLTKAGNLAGLTDPAQARLNLEAAPAVAATFRLHPNHGLQLFNPDTGSWHALTVRGQPGQESLEISAPITP
jgi:hypothetical protein